MPEVEYMTTMRLPPEKVWEFVRDMNNWAPFLTGYQKHEIQSETDSIWTLKGDVGVLSRTVRLKAHVTEWNGPERVSFTLIGLDEVVEGGGTLTIHKAGANGANGAGAGAAAAAAVASAVPEAKPPKKSWWRRLVDGWFRMMFRWMHGKGPKRAQLKSGEAESQLTFKLRMDAGGPSGPLVNAMLAPALAPAAEDLANKIAAHLESVHGLA